MIDVLQVIINGLLVGLVYGLVAVSFVVIYRSSRIVNLAQGEILLLGALFIWTFTLGVKLPWGIGVRSRSSAASGWHSFSSARCFAR